MISIPSVTYPAGTVLWVALGGAAGSVLRYLAGEGAKRLGAWASIPWATLTVNILGSLVLGFILRWSLSSEATPQFRAFLVIGLCGGFTTFSAFSAETAAMLQANQPSRAIAYALASVLLSVGAVFAGAALHGPRG